MERDARRDQSHHRDGRDELRHVDLGRRADTRGDAATAARYEGPALLGIADAACSGVWAEGFLAAGCVARYRVFRRIAGDHAADRVSDGAGVWLELEREPAAARRSAF